MSPAYCGGERIDPAAGGPGAEACPDVPGTENGAARDIGANGGATEGGGGIELGGLKVPFHPSRAEYLQTGGMEDPGSATVAKPEGRG